MKNKTNNNEVNDLIIFTIIPPLDLKKKLFCFIANSQETLGKPDFTKKKIKCQQKNFHYIKQILRFIEY